MLDTRLYEAHIPSPLPTFQSLHIPSFPCFSLILSKKPNPQTKSSRSYHLSLNLSGDFLFEDPIGRYGTENREGGDGVQSSGDDHALRQQLRSHGESSHQ